MTAPTRPGWWSEFIVTPVVTGTIAGIAAGIAVLAFTPAIVKVIHPPSCADPGDLVLARARVDPDTVSRGNNTVDRLVDGSTRTYWVPPDDGQIGATLRFTFDHRVDLQLICVVNGQPTSQQAYDGAGKLRSVIVATDATAGRRELVSPLLAQPAGQIQNAQGVEFDRGETGSATITVSSVYAGLDVLDPSENQWRPAGSTAVAEVEFYIAEDSR